MGVAVVLLANVFFGGWEMSEFGPNLEEEKTFSASLAHKLLLKMCNFMFCPGCGYWVWDVLYILLLLVIMLEATSDEKLMF